MPLPTRNRPDTDVSNEDDAAASSPPSPLSRSRSRGSSSSSSSSSSDSDAEPNLQIGDVPAEWISDDAAPVVAVEYGVDPEVAAAPFVHPQIWLAVEHRIASHLLEGGDLSNPASQLTHACHEAVTNIFHRYATHENLAVPAPHRTMLHSDMRRYIIACGVGEVSASPGRLDAIFRKYTPASDPEWNQFDQLTLEGWQEFYRQACFDRDESVWHDLQVHGYYAGIPIYEEEIAAAEAVGAEAEVVSEQGLRQRSGEFRYAFLSDEELVLMIEARSEVAAAVGVEQFAINEPPPVA